MKYLLFSALMCSVLGAGLLAATADKPVAKKPETPTTKPATQPAKPINQFCPVEKDNPVDPTVPTLVYQGKVIGFCCEDCIPKFKKDPAFYMKGLK